jgi:hypothetical protein
MVRVKTEEVPVGVNSIRRQIEVSPSVFHLIWSNWQEGDADENSILERLLMLFTEHRTARAVGSDAPRKYPAFLQETDPAGSPRTDEAVERPLVSPVKEDNIYEKDTGMFAYSPSNGFGKVRWVDDVRSALISLSGEADLSAIYREVERIRRVAGRSIVRSLEATVRQTIEAHSSDSNNFKPGNADYFRHAGRGRWALKR